MLVAGGITMSELDAEAIVCDDCKLGVRFECLLVDERGTQSERNFCAYFSNIFDCYHPLCTFSYRLTSRGNDSLLLLSSF